MHLAAGALELDRSVLQFANSAAPTQEVAVGTNVTALLMGSDGFGNLLDLQPLIMVCGLSSIFADNIWAL